VPNVRALARGQRRCDGLCLQRGLRWPGRGAVFRLRGREIHAPPRYGHLCGLCRRNIFRRGRRHGMLAVPLQRPLANGKQHRPGLSVQLWVLWPGWRAVRGSTDHDARSACYHTWSRIGRRRRRRQQRQRRRRRCALERDHCRTFPSLRGDQVSKDLISYYSVQKVIGLAESGWSR